MIAFVYKLTFANGKSYIGMTTHKPKRRYTNHESSARQGCNRPIYAAWRKYGPPKLSILSKVNSEQKAYKKEIQLIIKHNTLQPNGYNVSQGGDISPMIAFGGHSEKTKAKISAALKGRVSPNKGKKFSEVTKQKMSEAHKGRKGHKWTEEEKIQIALRATGKIQSAETREKKRIKAMGNKKTDGGRARISVAKKLYWIKWRLSNEKK